MKRSKVRFLCVCVSLSLMVCVCVCVCDTRGRKKINDRIKIDSVQRHGHDKSKKEVGISEKVEAKRHGKNVECGSGRCSCLKGKPGTLLFLLRRWWEAMWFPSNRLQAKLIGAFKDETSVNYSQGGGDFSCAKHYEAALICEQTQAFSDSLRLSKTYGSGKKLPIRSQTT